MPTVVLGAGPTMLRNSYLTIGTVLTLAGALGGCAGEILDGQNAGAAAGDPTTPGLNPDDLRTGPPVTGLDADNDGLPDVLSDLRDAAQFCPDSAGVGVGPTDLRRIHRSEYTHTIEQVLGIEGRGTEFVAEENIGPILTNRVAVTELQVDEYRVAAESIANRAASSLAPSLCAGSQDRTCAEQFVRDFGLKLLRRPLNDTEVGAYLDLYDVGTGRDGFEGGVRLVLQGLLQSPHFLYMVETRAAGTDLQPLDAYALASRLAFMFTNASPDDELLSAAASGQLVNAENLRSEAVRLLESPAGKHAIGQFHEEWLGIVHLQEPVAEKDAEVFPEYTNEVKAALRQEAIDFSDYVVRQDDGTFGTLLSANYGILKAPLFDFYDKTPGTSELVTFPEQERSGILTLGGTMAAHSHPDQTSPIRRGAVIRLNVLCQDLPPPPPDVDNAPPEVDPMATTRERFAQHANDPRCQGCHTLIDPLGFAFERYDATGAYRETENGLPIDTSGELLNDSPESDGPFAGAGDLSLTLSQSARAQQCYVKQWFRYAFKREVTTADACSAKAMLEAFNSSSQNIESLMLSIATTDAFRYLIPKN